MPQQISLLHIDGRQQDADIIGLLLKRCPQFQFAVEHVPGLREGIALAHDREFDAVLMDPCLPDSNGPNAIQRFKEAAPELPLVVLTGGEDEELGAAPKRRAVAAGGRPAPVYFPPSFPSVSFLEAEISACVLLRLLPSLDDRRDL